MYAKKNIRIAFTLVGRLVGRRKRALLLPVQSLVMARCLFPLATLAHDLNIKIYYTVKPSLIGGHEHCLISNLLDKVAIQIPSLTAHLFRWNLIVVADHDYFQSLAWSGSPLIYVGHGNQSKTSKRFPDIPWGYSHAPKWPNGRPIYHEVIEASQGVKQAILSKLQNWSDKIRVLGSLSDDQLLNQFQAFQENLENSTKKPLLLIISTLGDNSAFSRYWHELSHLAPSLAKDFDVIFCPHPNEFDFWSKKAKGNDNVRLPDRTVSTDNMLLQANLVITDYSSTCQKAALLNIPTIFCHLDNMPIWSQGATARLYALSQKWTPGTPIKQLIDLATEGSSSQKELVLSLVNSYPGRAKGMFTAWLKEYFNI